MIRIRHVAASAVLGVAVAAGLNGCAARNPDIPSDAVILSEGKNQLSTTAIRAGTIYIWDDSAHKMLYTGAVNNADHVYLDPQHDKITIAGKVVSQQELDDAHRYKIYFDEHPYVSGTMDQRPAAVNSDGTILDRRTTVQEKPAVIQEKTTVEREVRPQPAQPQQP